MKKASLLIITITSGLLSCNSGDSGNSKADSLVTPADSMVIALPDTGPVLPDTGSVQPEEAVPGEIDKNKKTYKNAAGETISASYQDAGEMGIVDLTIGNTSHKLMKGEKKSGITAYSNGKITWSVKGATATLEKDNVVSEYKESN